MPGRARADWLPRLLLVATQVLAAALVALLLLCPLARPDPGKSDLGSRLLFLFGADLTLRRTTIVVAVGLAATGWIFFRTRPILGRVRRPRKPPALPPPPGVAGA